MDDNTKIRTKPNSAEAEQSVISSMLKSMDAITAAEEILTKSDFYHSQFALLFETILQVKLEGGTVDLITVLDHLRKNNAPADIADPAYLNEVAEYVPFTGDVKRHAQLVRQKSLLRQIIDMNQEIQELCFQQTDSVDEILDKIEQHWLAILKAKGTSDFESTLEIARKTLEEIKTAYLNKKAVSGLATGFIDLDSMTSGLQPSDLVLVAARPAMGKTAFALNIARHIAVKNEKAVIVFSLEMSNTQLMKRFFSMESKIDARKLTSGRFTEDEFKDIIRTTGIMGKSKLILEEKSNTISDIRSKCRKAKQEYDVSLVIIDYLQLVSASKRIESRQQEVSEISRSLKSLARELKIPIIALSQLNRDLEKRENKRPMLSDLRESGAIEQDADIVMFLYRDDYYKKDSEKKGISEVIIAKQRNGPTGTVELKWIEENTLFRNLLNPHNTIQED